jgi:hypothetical protein
MSPDWDGSAPADGLGPHVEESSFGKSDDATRASSFRSAAQISDVIGVAVRGGVQVSSSVRSLRQ